MEMDSLKDMFNMHIKECDSRDVRNADAFKEIKNINKGMWDTIDIMKETITKLQIRSAFFLGGLMVLGKFFDYFIPLLHK